ncbi:MAG: Asp-tRNA(Asn)/Glu-tRNA(Gln) amidotransferase GatCAB subunit B, partial [Anaerolineaceae bacterium]
LPAAAAVVLTENLPAARYFEEIAAVAEPLGVSPTEAANWITGPLFAWVNETGASFEQVPVKPADLADLIWQAQQRVINLQTARAVLSEMLSSGRTAPQIIAEQNLGLVSEIEPINAAVQQVLDENPAELQNYLNGKLTLENWFFGQAMRRLQGKGNPDLLRDELRRALGQKKAS